MTLFLPANDHVVAGGMYTNEDIVICITFSLEKARGFCYLISVKRTRIIGCSKRDEALGPEYMRFSKGGRRWRPDGSSSFREVRE
jgi:hypothetical protein